MPGRWLTSFQVDLGELSLRANWALLCLRAVHFSYIVSLKDIIKNRNNPLCHAVSLFDKQFEVDGCLYLVNDELDYDFFVHAFDF